MKKIVFFAMIALLGSCASIPEGDVVGSVEGVHSDELIIRTMPIGRFGVRLDTISPYNGESVVFIDSLVEPVEVSITARSISGNDFARFNFVAVPGSKSVVKAEMVDGIIVGSIEGSSVFGEDFKKVETDAIPFKKAYGEANELKRDADKNKAFEDVAKMRGEYVKTHPESPLSAYYLLGLNRDYVVECYPTLKIQSGDLLTQFIGSNLESRYKQEKQAIDELKAVSVGGKYVDFETTTIPEGNKFVLSEVIEGKKAIIYFWGKWCDGGDIERMKRFASENDDYVIVAVNYGDKDDVVESIISSGNGAQKWKVVRNNDKKINVASKYKVEGYPCIIVLSPDGTITNRAIGVSDEFLSSLK